MKLGILRTGRPPPSLASHFPGYPEMFRRALGGGYTYAEYDAEKAQLPPSGAADAYLITGSASGVYDDLPWLNPLREWLRALDPAVPVMGICFGHQIMADAYGGTVTKSEKGWGSGLHSYNIVSRESWMDGEAPRFVIPAAHQDQVIKPPPTARIIAASDFCETAALTYRDRRAASFQGHPEFSRAYAEALVALRRSRGDITTAEAEQALASFEQPDDGARVARWIRNFFAA